MTDEKIELREFIPEKIQSGRWGNLKYIDLLIHERNDHLAISYYRDIHNQFGITPCAREYSIRLPKYISKSSRTFEVLGLLQGEMSKTHNKTIIFCNSEPSLNREVMDWFNDELGITYDQWHWYIKVNINQPENCDYRKEVENKVIEHWMRETRIIHDMRYPTTVSYIKNTNHKVLDDDDFGSLIFEYKSNAMSEIVKNLVRKFTYEKILGCNEKEIIGFMRGILAAESCVEIHLPTMKYRIHISAINPLEKEIFHKCLEKIGVGSKVYGRDKVIVSKRHNNFRLLSLDLMSLNPTKHRKFLELISCYHPGEEAAGCVREESAVYAVA